MYYELSKADKKIARACIEKGRDAELRAGLEHFENILSNWRAGKYADDREAYGALYQAVREQDKAMAMRYDALSGFTLARHHSCHSM